MENFIKSLNYSSQKEAQSFCLIFYQILALAQRIFLIVKSTENCNMRLKKQLSKRHNLQASSKTNHLTSFSFYSPVYFPINKFNLQYLRMGQCCTNENVLLQHHELNLVNNLESSTTIPTKNALDIDNAKEGALINKQDVEAPIKEEISISREQQQLKVEEIALEIEQVTKDEFLDFHKFIHLYRKCLHEYHAHDIEHACDLIKELRQLQREIQEVRNIEEKVFLDQVKTIESEWKIDYADQIIEHYNPVILHNMEEELKDLFYYQHQLNKAPFVEKYLEDGIKISTRKDDDTIGAKIQTQLHVPFENLTSILSQIPYFIDFIPFCDESRLIKDCARNSKVGYVVLNMPFIAKREAYFQGLCYFRMIHKQEIFLYTRSIHDKPELQKTYSVDTPINKNYVQLNYKYFIIKYEPIREGVGKLTFAFNIDNGIHFLPEFLEDYIVRDFGKKIFKRIIEISKQFSGTKWEKSVKQKPDLFEFVKQRINELLTIRSKQQK